MSLIDSPKAQGLIERVRLILTKPREAWDIIDGETATVRDLYTGYACILAALPPLAMLIRHVVFTSGGFGIVALLVIALFQYGLGLAMLFVVAMIADAFAPSFEGQKNQTQALKAIVYTQTAVWVGGACAIVPILGGIGVVIGIIYSIYLLYLGLPKLMKVPADKAAGFVVVVVIVGIVVGWVAFGLPTMIVGVLGFGLLAATSYG